MADAAYQADLSVAGSADASTAPSCTSRVFDRYFSFIARHNKPLLVLWLLVGVASGVIGPSFFGATSASGGDVKGTPVYEANAIFARQFPEASNTDTLIILLVRTVPRGWPANDTSVLTPV